ncbi:DUF1436 family protein [Providencia sp. wls1943]|uniref:contact-dependent growth inhibition system immunity protein n=1 Tax=Providencia sp. wls1943 TaxID=2675150 RepID=UPI0012B57D3D|nr:contact-dependent growth inhibition system immunity protein [Providencia sp. wls1943]MTB67874.1 DUF1436 family protein [Providencia sp. wls1943]
MYDSERNIAVRRNERFYFIFVFSGYHLFIKDDKAPVYCLEKEVSDEKLGETINLAFSQCRTIHPYENEEFYNKEKINEDYKLWVSELLTKCQFKNKKALFLRMMTCNLKKHNNEILIKPMWHKKLEIWTRDGFTDDDNIILPQTVSNEELGKAVKEGMSRCRNSV